MYVLTAWHVPVAKSSPKSKVLGVYSVSSHSSPECHPVLLFSGALHSASQGTHTVSLGDTHLPESERVGAVAAAAEAVLAQVVLLALGAPGHAARKTQLSGWFGMKSSGQNLLRTRQMGPGSSECPTLD